MKKSLLSKTVVLGLMTATVWSFACVASAEQVVGDTGYVHKHKEEQIVFAEDAIAGTKLKDPNLKHPAVGNHTDACREEVDDTTLTIGDINKVADTLVNNDKELQTQINELKNKPSGDTDTDTDTRTDVTVNKDANGVISIEVTEKKTETNVKTGESTETPIYSKTISDIASTGYVDNAVAAEADARQNNDIVGGKINSTTGEITLTKGGNSTISVGEICDSRLETATYNSKKGELTLTVKDHYNNDQEKEIKVGDIASKEKLETEVEERKAEDARIEQKFDKEVSRLDSKIDKLDGRIEKVGAMSAAIANLHTMGYDPAAPTEIAVGVGQYRDKTGLALGAFHYPNRDFMMSFSVSTAGDEFMAGIGATWKIGRKSPEQMLKAQQEKAAREKLAEAEAMKKAAKDARVAAQQARHAKMLAERSK